MKDTLCFKPMTPRGHGRQVDPLQQYCNMAEELFIHTAYNGWLDEIVVKDKMTINEIINSNPSRITKGTDFISLDHLVNIFEMDEFYGTSTYCLSRKMRSRITNKNFMNDECNDGRSRTIEILFIDDKPVTFHQYIGKGRVDNVKLLNSKLLNELYLDYMSCNKPEFDETPLDEDIEIINYNMRKTLYINNKIISR